MDIKERISMKLQEIEEKENVLILHAIESGSRAWGFASPDSDYDVRFIYVRDVKHYLCLEEQRDVIEWQLDETLDINGWDLQKALRLLHKSNPTLFEWNNSPIVYKTTKQWENLRKVINKYFLDKAGLHHYLSTAHSNYREYLKGETVRLKKYFYVIRPILACKWILEKKCPPPMLFSDLIGAVLEVEMKPVIKDLLLLKINSPEIGEGKRIDVLNEYIEKNLDNLKTIINSMPVDKRMGWEELNDLFINTLNLNN